LKYLIYPQYYMPLVIALGLSPQVAFPIMMGSCAFLMPPASVKFIKEGAYNRKAAIGMAIPSIIAVLIAAFIVKSLPLDTLRWLFIVVIVYTSAVMLRSAYSKYPSVFGNKKALFSRFLRKQGFFIGEKSAVIY
jgi:uncharacterized membrane protein YfcA